MINSKSEINNFNKHKLMAPIPIESVQIFNLSSVTLGLWIKTKVSENKSGICWTCCLNPILLPHVPQRYKWIANWKIARSSVLQFRIKSPMTFKLPIKQTKVVVVGIVEGQVPPLKVVTFTNDLWVFPLLPGCIQLVLGENTQVVLLCLGLDQMVLVELQVSNGL